MIDSLISTYWPLLLTNYPFVIAVIIMFLGLFTILYANNLIKKVIGLNIFQVSIITFYIALSHINGSLAPIIHSTDPQNILYTNPLPHVLMLTAIVVSIALTSVAFALIIRIKINYKTIYENELMDILKRSKQ